MLSSPKGTATDPSLSNMRPPPMTTSARRRALRMLATSPNGRTVANMLAHGFTNAMLDSLEHDGLVTLQPGTVRTGTRRITVVWVAITDNGRAVLAVQS